MSDPITTTKYRAKDGTQHDSERVDAVLAQIGILKPDPKPGSSVFDDELDDYSGKIKARRHAFNSGARAAIEAVVNYRMIKPGNIHV